MSKARFFVLAFPLLAGLAATQHAMPPVSGGKTLESTGPSPVEADFPSGGLVNLRICPSGLLIKGTLRNQIRVTFAPGNSSDAQDLRARLRVSAPSPATAHAEIQIQNCPHNNFHITVEVPTTVDLHVRMGAGQLEVTGVSGNKDLELSAGQLTVEVDKTSEYGHVDGSVLSGEVAARAWGVSKGGLFRSFSQEGPGKYRLHAHVGAGQVMLHNVDN